MGLPFTVIVFWLISSKATSFVPGSTALASTVRMMTSSSSWRLHFGSIFSGAYSVSAMRVLWTKLVPMVCVLVGEKLQNGSCLGFHVSE